MSDLLRNGRWEVSKICIKLIVFFLEKGSINSASKQSTIMSSSSWTSLYIPVVPSDLAIGDLVMDSEMAFQHYFEYMLPIGKVSRVDFVSKPSRDGSYSVTSAFVHFSTLFDQSSVYRDVCEDLARTDDVRLAGGASAFDGFPLFFVSATDESRKRFITIKVNKTPIKRAAEIPKNIHQIINNYGLMESIISDQNAQIEELSALVGRLRQTILEMESYEGEDLRFPAIVEDGEEIEDDGPMSLVELI